MSKQVDKFVVAVSVCLLAACWMLATEKTAQAQVGAQKVFPNYTCLDLSGDECSVTGDAACTYNWNEYGECSTLCEYCDSDDVFDWSVCVYTYPGESCTTTSGNIQCYGSYYLGYCDFNEYGYCECMYGVEQNLCIYGPFYGYYC
jgi:hypothetical protein